MSCASQASALPLEENCTGTRLDALLSLEARRVGASGLKGYAGHEAAGEGYRATREAPAPTSSCLDASQAGPTSHALTSPAHDLKLIPYNFQTDTTTTTTDLDSANRHHLHDSRQNRSGAPSSATAFTTLHSRSEGDKVSAKSSETDQATTTQINMLQNVTCRHLCTSHLNAESSTFLTQRIQEYYSQNWLVDGLPAAEMKQDEVTKELFYSAGFALGSLASPDASGKAAAQINNHFDIFLEYHSRDKVHNRVVGAVVWPRR